MQDDLLEHLKEYFRARGTDMPATNVKQATLIPSAQSIPNRQGTAPGWWVETGGKTIVSMPGPPSELQGIWEEEIVPRMRQPSYETLRGEVILTRNIKTTGISEGGLDEMVSEYLGVENPYLGIYAKPDGIHLRIIARAPDEESGRALIEHVEHGLVSIVGPYIWGYDDETPESAVGHLLTQKNLTLATMESCTGGLLASSVTEIPGSHSYFKGGMVIYNSGSAIASGVPESILEKSGMVSPEAAEAMAQAAREQLKADIGIGLTGVAGPDEPFRGLGTDGNPAGTIHIAIALDGTVRHFPSRWPPRRTVIRRRAVADALAGC